MAWFDYLRLVRFGAHVTFLGVVVTALFFADEMNLALFRSLLLLYISFNVLLYGGIYTINDIVDLKSDKRNPLKKNRPLPTGKMSVKSALIFAVVLVVMGLVTGFVFFGKTMLYIYLLFILLNFFYTYIAKNVHYLYLAGAAITHPLRGLMAIVLVNSSTIPYFLLTAYFFLVLGSTCNRKIVERDVNGREVSQVLRKYSMKGLLFIEILSFLAILVLFLIDNFSYRLLYFTIIFFYVTFVFGVYFSKQIRNLCRSILTH